MLLYQFIFLVLDDNKMDLSAEKAEVAPVRPVTIFNFSSLMDKRGVKVQRPVRGFRNRDVVRADESAQRVVPKNVQQNLDSRPEVRKIDAFLGGKEGIPPAQRCFFYEPLQLLPDRKHRDRSVKILLPGWKLPGAHRRRREPADARMVRIAKPGAIKASGLVYELDPRLPWDDRKPGPLPITYVELTNVHRQLSRHLTDEYICHSSGRAPSLPSATSWFSSPGFIVQRPQRIVQLKHKVEYEAEGKRERVFG